MRLHLAIVLIGMVFVVWLMGSSFADSARSVHGPCPSDLHVHYEWRAGSLPPPYHYEYTIEVRGTGEGKIVMIPDYPTEKAPVWTESFSVDRAALDQLCDRMAAEGLWTEQWRSLDQPLLGGSSEFLTVTGDSKSAAIPAFPVPHQKGRADAIYRTVRSLVSESLWTKLDAQRQQYQKRNPAR